MLIPPILDFLLHLLLRTHPGVECLDKGISEGYFGHLPTLGGFLLLMNGISEVHYFKAE